VTFAVLPIAGVPHQRKALYHTMAEATVFCENGAA
jgi:hypothetical protein